MPRIAHIPTLLLWGNKDAAVDPASARQLCQQFSDCRIEMFEGVGHLPYEEVPEEFNSALVGILVGPATARFSEHVQLSSLIFCVAI